MNAEYISHARVWQMLKPKLDVGLETSNPFAWAPSVSIAGVPESLDLLCSIMDPATLTHGLRELASPLSE